MIPDPNSFEDDALKSAVKRVWGGERAPAELRSKIEALLSHGTTCTHEAGARNNTSAVIRVAPSFWRRRATLGMAAAVVLGLGLFAVYFSKTGGSNGGISMPEELGTRLARVHDACCKAAVHDQHFYDGAPRDDFTAIARVMKAELRHPVIAAPVGHDWEFHGAMICAVGPTRSAHLVFARGDAFVSVFSLPTSAFPACPDKQNCDHDVNGHPMAGFSEGGAFFCVIGSSGGKNPIDLPQVKAIRDQFRGDALAAATPPVRLAVALP